VPLFRQTAYKTTIDVVHFETALLMMMTFKKEIKTVFSKKEVDLEETHFIKSMDRNCSTLPLSIRFKKNGM